jgi:hypothetical protein
MLFCKKIIVIVILFLCYSIAYAQIISGIVCDKTSKLPISDVYVYIDGTSINTITNNLGKFELKTNSIINSKLVLHHLSYETAIINNPFEGLPDTLYIKEQIKTLSEITVRADRFTREQKMKAFREQFLGMTRAGKSCTIANEDDIQIKIDMQTRRLLASSDKPIVVVNNYLGYTVSFVLVDFWIQYGVAVVNLDSDYVQGSFFAVVSLFTDMAPNNRRIRRHRDNVYEKSSNFFFKSLRDNVLKDNKFMMFNNSLPVNHQDYFAIKDTLSQKMISIIPDTDIKKNPDGFHSVPKLSGIVSVLYRRTDQSDIYFMTDSFLVDRYGNTDQIDKISFGGQMGKNRAGDLLPINYELMIIQIE